MWAPRHATLPVQIHVGVCRTFIKTPLVERAAVGYALRLSCGLQKLLSLILKNARG